MVRQVIHKTDISKLSAGSAILESLRSDYKKTGQKLIGSPKKDLKREERIQKFLQKNHAIGLPALKTSSLQPALERLLTRFEHLCNKLECTNLTASSRNRIYKLLAKELIDNSIAFGIEPKLAVTATLLNGDLRPLATHNHVGKYAKNRSLLYRALTARPGDIKKFFLEGKKRLKEINDYLNKSDLNLSEMLKMRLAFYKLGVPTKELVDKHFELSSQILKDPEFKEFYSKREYVLKWLLEVLAEDKIRPRLRKIIKQHSEILNAPMLASFKNRPADIIFALVHQPDNTIDFLTNALNQEDFIKQELNKRKITVANSRIGKLCVKKPLKAKELETFLRINQDKDTDKINKELNKHLAVINNI
jgi:hypothetical protein